MTGDYSWGRSADEYIKMYERLTTPPLEQPMPRRARRRACRRGDARRRHARAQEARRPQEGLRPPRPPLRKRPRSARPARRPRPPRPPLRKRPRSVRPARRPTRPKRPPRLPPRKRPKSARPARRLTPPKRPSRLPPRKRPRSAPPARRPTRLPNNPNDSAGSEMIRTVFCSFAVCLQEVLHAHRGAVYVVAPLALRLQRRARSPEVFAL